MTRAERGGVQVGGGLLAGPGRGEVAEVTAGGVDGIAGTGGGGLRVDAEVLAGGVAEREKGARGGGWEVGEEEAELGVGSLRHFRRAPGEEELLLWTGPPIE